MRPRTWRTTKLTPDEREIVVVATVTASGNMDF